MQADKIRSALFAAVICTAGGAVFYAIHAPLPWMLGALAFAAITAVSGRRWFIPVEARVVARPVVGVLAGSAFTPAVVAASLQWWDSILLVLAQGVAVTLLGYVFLLKVGRFDRHTAFFSAAPGGLGEMALLGSTLGADVRKIVLTHTMRIVLVLYSMPFALQLVLGHPIGRSLPTSPADVPPGSVDWIILAACGFAGYGLARVLPGFPAGFMVFPMILSAVVHAMGLTEAVPPPLLVAAVQIVIGGVAGARFFGIRWREMAGTLLFGGTWAILMVALTAASAYGATAFIDREFVALMLALAPGGMVEMTILTFSIGIEVAFVATCQIVRILFVLMVTPLINQALIPTRKQVGQASGKAPDKSAGPD